MRIAPVTSLPAKPDDNTWNTASGRFEALTEQTIEQLAQLDSPDRGTELVLPERADRHHR